MELLIGAVVVFILYKLVFGRKGNSGKSGGCKYCGGELFTTSKKGYSFNCKDCRTEFP